jgi:hypothetical protein
VTLVAVMFAGCVKETRNVESDGYVYKKGTVSFALPATGKKVAYTRAEALTSEETLANLVIYQFGNVQSFGYGGILEKIYASEEVSMSGARAVEISGNSDEGYEVTINIGGDTGHKIFYLVANVNGTGNSALSSALSGFTPGVTTKEAFEAAAVTDDLEGTNAVVSLTTPLPMSNAPTSYTKGIEVNDVLTPGYVAVTLKRSVARFDIVNHEDYTNFTVTGIVVKKGNLSGELVDKDLSYTPKTGDGVTDDLSATANGNDDINPAEDYVSANDPTSGLNANGRAKSLNPAQFYLYPTTVKMDGSGTEIFVVGEFDGEGFVYPVTVTEDVDIKANFVYQIEVQRAELKEYTFTLVQVADWSDYNASTITAEKGDVVAEFGNLSDKDGEDLETTIYDYSEKSGEELELQVETASTSDLGAVVTVASIANEDGYTADPTVVEAAVQVVSGDPTVVTRSSTALFKQVHVITLPQPATPFKARVTIRDKKSLVHAREYTISSLGWYPGTTENPVRVGGVYWAPVNAGATTLVKDFNGVEMTVANVGNFYVWGNGTPFWPGAELPTAYSGGNGWPADQDPCPAGWRLPSLDEIKLLAPKEGNALVAAKKVVTIQGDGAGKTLYLPCGGMGDSNGTHGGAGETAAVWSNYSTPYVHWLQWPLENGAGGYASFDDGPGIRAEYPEKYNMNARCLLVTDTDTE